MNVMQATIAQSVQRLPYTYKLSCFHARFAETVFFWVPAPRKTISWLRFYVFITTVWFEMLTDHHQRTILHDERLGSHSPQAQRLFSTSSHPRQAHASTKPQIQHGLGFSDRGKAVTASGWPFTSI